MQNDLSKLKLFYTAEGVVSILKEYHAHIQEKHDFPPLSGMKPTHALAEVLDFKSAEPFLNAIAELHLVELQKPSTGKYAEIERRTQYLRQMMPEYLTGERWYDSGDFFRMLISKHYHKDVAEELCDIYRDVAKGAFDRGVFAGVKQQMQVYEKEAKAQAKAELESDKILSFTVIKQRKRFGAPEINTQLFKSPEAFDEHIDDAITSLMFTDGLNSQKLIDACSHIMGMPAVSDTSVIKGDTDIEVSANILKLVPSNIKASVFEYLAGDLTVSIQTH